MSARTGHENIVPLGRERSEDDLALTFVTSNPDLRYVAAWDQWLYWNGICWAHDLSMKVYDMIRAHCRNAGYAPLNANVVAGVQRLARADQRCAMLAEHWDQIPWLLNTPKGIVDLRTGTLADHDPKRFMTKMTAVGPLGRCPRWMRFLTEITNGDVQVIDYLQRLFGYALTGLAKEQCLGFLYGQGANGKSTFLNVLTGILDEYAVVAPMNILTETHSERHPTELAMLRGARLVVAHETEGGRHWAEARVKTLTGGDPITARRMRQDFFTFKPQFTLLIDGNHRPRLRNVDEAMRRRMHLIPFEVTIPEQERDPNLSDKLQKEWPGILAWAIQGCLAYQKHGLMPPERVIAATKDYFNAQDDIAAWLAECCHVAPNNWIAGGQLFQSWSRFAQGAGIEAGDMKWFTDKLENAGFSRAKTGARGRHWKGLTLKSSQEAFSTGEKG